MEYLVANGLTYKPNYVSEERAKEIIKFIEGQEWSKTLSRRTQQYGYEYNYAKGVSKLEKVHPIPDILKIFGEEFNQVIINEYEPGQGISAHTDHQKFFGNKIVSISLLSPIIMNFANNNVKIPVALEPNSCVIMEGDARYKWTHEIPSRKSDVINGTKIARSKRISLTFRNYVGSE